MISGITSPFQRNTKTSQMMTFEQIRELVEFEVLTAVVMKNSIFWDATSCNPLKVKRRLMTATYLTLVSLLAYSSTLKMEATCSFETSVDFQWTIRCYIPEDTTLQPENLLHILGLPRITLKFSHRQCRHHDISYK
jgi:hypothetical protein